jgi:hypothetical protein
MGRAQRPSPRIRADEAALMLGCSLRLAQKLLSTGKLQGAKVGAIWTTTAADVQAYLNKQTKDPDAPCPPTSTSAARSTGRASRSTDAMRDAAYERIMGRRPSAA